MRRISWQCCAAVLLLLAMARLCLGQGKDASASFFKSHPNAIDFEDKDECVRFANRQVGVEITKSEGGFQVSRLYSVKHDQEFLAADMTPQSANLFQIVMQPDPAQEKHVKPGRFVIGPLSAKSVSVERTGDDSQSLLHLQWKGIDVADDKDAMDVDVLIRLKAEDPFSRWRFAIVNRSIQYGIERVYFPILNLAPIGDAKDNVTIYPMVRGRLVEDPFHRPPGYGDGVHKSGRYPGAFGMQFQALYNKTTGAGLYLGTEDPVPSLKNTETPNSPTHITWKPGHFPPNMRFANANYTLPYDCVIGPFSGDWWDACQIYRRWALKQSWCAKGPLATRKDIPTWYKEAPLFAAVYQDYIPRYGMTIHIEPGDAFYMEVASLFVEGAQIGRLPLDPIAGGLSFDNPDHKEMLDFLGQVVALYRQDVAKEFLCYGQLMRPLQFREPEPMPSLSYSTGGRTVEMPSLLSGVFRSSDGELGIFIVNASPLDLPFAADMDLTAYGIPNGTTVDAETISAEGTVKPYVKDVKDKLTIRGRLPPRQMVLVHVRLHEGY